METMNDERGTMNDEESTANGTPRSSFIVHRSSLRGQRGFTLIELLVVVTIIGILAGIALVNVRGAQKKAQEAALRADLHEMRKAIDDYYADKQKFPGDLNELVPHYLRAIPKDPITKAADWDTVQNQPGTEDSPAPEPTEAEKNGNEGGAPGIVDVKSKARGKTSDNVPYDQL
jgi:general secretion pathway protein G